MRSGPTCRPPWWPDGERGPWPHHAGDGRRRRSFFRRVAFLAAVMLTLCASGSVALGWLVASSLGVVSPSTSGGPVVLVLGLAGAALAALAGLTMMRRFGLPLRSLMEAAERVAAGDYAVRVAEHGPPAMRALVRSFNLMTARLADHDRLRRNLMADVAHELRTPLTIVQGKVEGLLDGVYPRDEAQLRQVLDETHVLSRLVEDLRTLALSESGALKLQRESTDVAALAREVARAFADEATRRELTVAVDAPAALEPTEVDPLRIREVLSNLLSNALRATPGGGTVTLRVTPSGAGGLAVEVRDTGTGMTPDELARAFDRFQKGSRSRGSGLGLAIARGLVEAHGGTIEAESAAGRGTTLRFTIPRQP